MKIKLVSKRDCKARGFTFIELLIVLVIVGMGWFTLVPNLNLAGKKGSDDLVKVNALLYSVKMEALNKNTRQEVWVNFTKGKVEWKSQAVSFGEKVSSGSLGGSASDPNGLNLVVYSEGFSEEVRLVLDDGRVLYLDPLTVRFSE